MLLGKYPAHQVGTYLLLVGHLQETAVFDETPEVLEAVGMPKGEIPGYIETFKQRWAQRKGAA
jgi:hypothetical protein